MIAHFLIENVCTGYSDVKETAICSLNPIGCFEADIKIARCWFFTVGDLILMGKPDICGGLVLPEPSADAALSLPE